ncbi:MAG: hypothetical protein KDB00_16425 [Planctomycetales bacterium]|nr:hypothetical protein [Planctomycetales bacterium]
MARAGRRQLRDALKAGPQIECEIVGVKVTLLDGDQHENDSSEMSFKTCAAKAMREEVLPGAGLVLLEPVMNLEVELPEEYLGAVTGYLARKRGVITSANTGSGVTVIAAEAPLAELFEFSSDVRSMTQGNGTFTMHPLAYRQTPSDIQQMLLSQ